MKKTILIALSIVILAGVAFVFAFKAKPENAETKTANEIEKQKTTVIFSRSTESISFFFDFAKDEGFFEKQGLEVEYVEAVKNGFQTFISGASDFFVGGLGTSTAAYAAGSDPRVLADLTKISNQYLVSRFSKEEANSIKNVAIPNATTNDSAIAKEFLRTLGVDPEAVEYISISNSIPARMAALESGNADAISAQSYREIKNSGAFEKYSVFDINFIPKKLPYDKFIVSTQEFIEKNPETVQRFINAYFEGIQYIKANPEKTKEYLKRKYEYTQEETDAFYDSLMNAQQDLNFVPDVEVVEASARESAKESKIELTRDLKDFISPTFAQEAVSRQK